MFIVEGIAFYIAPNNLANMFAASPSATANGKRMNLVVAETIRVLPIFLTNYPRLHSIMRGRTLVVRMIENYDKQNAVVREQTLEWNVLNAFLDARR